MARKFRAIQTVRSNDAVTDSELGRLRYASGKMEAAALGARLAEGFLAEHTHIPGAMEELKHVRQAAEEAEGGGKDLLLGALTVEKAPTYTHKFVSMGATRVMSQEAPGFDVFAMVSPAMSTLFGDKDKEIERLARIRASRSVSQVTEHYSGERASGNKGGDYLCFRCGKGGHKIADCTQKVVGSTAAGTAGVATAPSSK